MPARAEPQWDAPNGWAPLHWIAVAGLRRYGEEELARKIGTRFLADVRALYASQRKLVEKYAVEGSGAAGAAAANTPCRTRCCCRRRGSGRPPTPLSRRAPPTTTRR